MTKHQEICLFTLNHSSKSMDITSTVDDSKESFIFFPENSLEHFTSLLSKYNVVAINKLPSFQSVNIIYGDASVVSKIANS
jgi:hypothetical protein